MQRRFNIEVKRERIRSVMVCAAASAVVMAAVGCGSAGDDEVDAGPTLPPGLPTAVSTAGAGQEATLGGLPLVSVRTLPPAALSAEQLEPAGIADLDGGGSLPMATTVSGGAQPWEFVSTADDGWLVWQPDVVLDVLHDAGTGATLVTVERVDWPDACLGAAEADEVCATVITPGYRVILQRDGSLIEYHTALASGFRVASGGGS